MQIRISQVLLVVCLAFMGVFYLIPLIIAVRTSFAEPSQIGFTNGGFTLASFASVLQGRYYGNVVASTLLISLIVCVISVVAAYPIALLVTLGSRRVRSILLVLVVAPMMTSSIARTFGWVVILGPRGLISSLLVLLGAPSSTQFLGTSGGIAVALGEIYLPYALLTMISGFGSLTENLIYAAKTSGATNFAVFRRVTLPLTLPSASIAAMLVFVLSASAYATPRILGSGKVHVLATEIFDEATVTLNWPLASALSMFLVFVYAVILGGVLVIRRRTKVKERGIG